MKTITLPCFGIVVQLGPAISDGRGYEGGIITSDLKEPCPDCGKNDCARTCRFQAERQDYDAEDRKDARLMYNAAIDGLESMILACACAGIDIESPAFLIAIETSEAAIGSNFPM